MNIVNPMKKASTKRSQPNSHTKVDKIAYKTKNRQIFFSFEKGLAFKDQATF